MDSIKSNLTQIRDVHGDVACSEDPYLAAYLRSNDSRNFSDFDNYYVSDKPEFKNIVCRDPSYFSQIDETNLTEPTVILKESNSRELNMINPTKIQGGNLNINYLYIICLLLICIIIIYIVNVNIYKNTNLISV